MSFVCIFNVGCWCCCCYYSIFDKANSFRSKAFSRFWNHKSISSEAPQGNINNNTNNAMYISIVTNRRGFSLFLQTFIFLYYILLFLLMYYILMLYYNKSLFWLCFLILCLTRFGGKVSDQYWSTPFERHVCDPPERPLVSSVSYNNNQHTDFIYFYTLKMWINPGAMSVERTNEDWVARY